MNEIAYILDGCYEEDMLLNHKLIIRILYLLVKEHKLENYVKEVKFQKLHHSLALYDNEKKYIAVDIDKCYEEAYETTRRVKSTYKLKKRFMTQTMNLLIMHTLLHEIEHAKQDKLYTEYDKDMVINQLYKISITHQFETNKNLINKSHLKKLIKYLKFISKKYESFHDLFPIERMANITAYKDLISIYNMTEYKNKYVERLFLINYYVELLSDYTINDGQLMSPLTSFLDEKYKWSNKSGLYIRDKDYRKLNNDILFNNIDTENKMNYGVDISMDEYNKVTKKLENNWYLVKRGRK